MKAYTGSVYVNDFNMFNRVYKVYIQAEAPYRAHKDNINMFFVKTAGGDMVPLTALGDAEYTTGPGNIRRFNMFTTAVVRGAAAPGYSSGEVMRKMENIARTHLPENIGVEWSGLSYQEKKCRGTAGAGIDSGIPVRLPLSGCFIRKLAGAGGCLAVVARCCFGGLSGHSGIWARERYLFPDRFGDFDRSGC